MSARYSSLYRPPAPALNIRVTVPGVAPSLSSLSAMLDTGADGTLIPLALLKQIEAIPKGDVVLRTALGNRSVHRIYEVDIHLESVVLPSVVVAAYDQGHGALLGRNVLNKLILLLDGRALQTDVLAARPKLR